MSTDAQDGDDLEERINSFLRRNFPQIQMHGGSHAIRELDRETGEVHLTLGGACSGCGISPMTIQAIKARMTQEIPEIETVVAETGGMEGGDGGMSPSFPGETEDEGDDGGDAPEAPF
jgi:Fe-S cluster biogenesis protein NfuA